MPRLIQFAALLWVILVLGCMPSALKAGPQDARSVSEHQVDPTITLADEQTIGIFRLNGDFKRRDNLLGIDVAWGQSDIGGTVQVENIPLPLLETLFRERFIAPDDKQNEAPTAQEFLEFMRRYPATIAFGYVVSPERDDYRVTIDGIRISSEYVTPELKQAFIEFSKNADELYTDDELGSWWD